jgi:predicted enzyme related to lactoylglutathione lyase
MNGPRPIVHLELHTCDLASASNFYERLLEWQAERIETPGGSYVALGLGGGVVQCGVARAVWLPYVEVDRIERATEHARRLGAAVLVEPREGPAGWRSVVSRVDAGEVALWQSKDAR